ncbi:MAG: hypothetical protein HQ591_10570 [candidate division Zixibacteria bacterium]|nr:hypothetical protein [Candidatus Tariuqbacter arcticus]
MNPGNFSKNVFINCPFDNDYIPLLRPLLFTILYLDYNPRIASERFDSGETRITKICELIEESKFSIHDISRMESTRRNDIPRFNMPFELGIDIGCRRFKNGEAKTKVCLVLEKERYRYQKAISDLSGSDIKNHNNNPEDIILNVRNWFIEVDLQEAPSSTLIWDDFNDFMADFYEKREEEGFTTKDLQMMPIPEYIGFIKKWLEERK